jgi:uncharacterized membrane protein YsdA (DUF1294 family)
MAPKELHWVVMAILLVLQFLSYGMYRSDKSKSITGGRRTTENTLLLWALAAPFGALWGMFGVRHKTRKFSFLVRVWPLLVLGLALYAIGIFTLLGGDPSILLPLWLKLKLAGWYYG